MLVKKSIPVNIKVILNINATWACLLFLPISVLLYRYISCWKRQFMCIQRYMETNIKPKKSTPTQLQLYD